MLPPTAPPEINTLWALGVAAATGLIFQGLKKVSDKVNNLPDAAKAIIAFVIAFGTTKLSTKIGVPLPHDLQGFTGALVNWAAAMGVHALAKKTGLVKDGSQP